MTHETDVVIGLDIGTTSAKAVIQHGPGRDAYYTEQPTPWHTYPDGRTEIDRYASDSGIDLWASSSERAESTT